jgi:hypothetical protein
MIMVDDGYEGAFEEGCLLTMFVFSCTMRISFFTSSVSYSHYFYYYSISEDILNQRE